MGKLFDSLKEDRSPAKLAIDKDNGKVTIVPESKEQRDARDAMRRCLALSYYRFH